MFKSWIRDVNEAVVNYPGPSGVPAIREKLELMLSESMQ